MGNLAIRTENLGKRYRLGAKVGLRSFRDILGGTLVQSIRGLVDRCRFDARASLPVDEDDGMVWALRDAAIEVRHGETIGIIGKNGAGKSTLLSLLCRITAPTTGTAELHGRVASLLEVGTGFHPELTGRDNIYLNGAILGMNKREIRRKFDEIVVFAEVERFIDTAVKHYSSGMFVRLAFSVACHMEPDILVADEALNVGDIVFQQKCLDKIRTITGEGRTVLFVSHNMDTVRNLCHKAMWLRDGRIAMVGSTSDVAEKYIEDMFRDVSATTELRDFPRGGEMGSRLRLCRLEVNGGKPVQHGEAVKLRVEYETCSDIGNVSLGFVFSTLQGTHIMNVDSALGDSRKTLPAGKKGVAEVTLNDFMLQPGQYLLDTRAGADDLKTLDYLPACTRINVTTGPTTPKTVNHDGSGLRISGAWEWL